MPGMLTVLSNRIGDVALLIVTAWIINFGSWSFIYYFEFLAGSFEIELISFLVVLAAMTKSAQIHFFFLIACGYSCPYTCICFSAFFYFGYCGSLFIDSFQPFFWLLVTESVDAEGKANFIYRILFFLLPLSIYAFAVLPASVTEVGIVTKPWP